MPVVWRRSADQVNVSSVFRPHFPCFPNLVSRDLLVV
jgi:hypothetical protein